MKHNLLYVVFMAVILVSACKNEPKNSVALPVKPTLENTPETVVRQWQGWVDRSQFDNAAYLSTPRAQQWIAQISSIFGTDTTAMTNFKSIKCNVKDTTGMCYCIITEDKEIFEDSFLLVQRNNQWLIDISEEQSQPQDNEVLQNLLKSAEAKK
jgi:hypothetical protein